jgi:hypothetical protein
LALHEEGVAKKVRQILEDTYGQSFIMLEKSISPEVQSQVIFKTELSLERGSNTNLVDELLHSLNQFRNSYLKSQLKIARVKLEEEEKAGEGREMVDDLKTVVVLQDKLKQKPYTLEDLK